MFYSIYTTFCNYFKCKYKNKYTYDFFFFLFQVRTKTKMRFEITVVSLDGCWVKKKILLKSPKSAAFNQYNTLNQSLSFFLSLLRKKQFSSHSIFSFFVCLTYMYVVLQNVYILIFFQPCEIERMAFLLL